MVRVLLDNARRQVLLEAMIITYGHAADADITGQIAEEIEIMWNEAAGSVVLEQVLFPVRFRVESSCQPGIDPYEVITNTDPRRNFFRIEEFALGNISFVDGIGSNTGYFKQENLYPGSTTAAHEFGHGLGLDHPGILDIRGQGRPGIMYPRGTWVDPAYQYDPAAAPGTPGGTMHPMHRRVRPDDIRLLGLERLRFRQGTAVLGAFSNIYHPDHASLPH
jgi:hypothetical protein